MRTIRSMKLGISAVAIVLGMGFMPLEVRAGDQAPDSWVTLKSKIAVWTTVGMPGSDINVDTVRGHVTLHGTVASWNDRSRAPRRRSERSPE